MKGNGNAQGVIPYKQMNGVQQKAVERIDLAKGRACSVLDTAE